MRMLYIVCLTLAIIMALASVYFIIAPSDGTCNTCPDCFIDGWAPGSIIAAQLNCLNRPVGVGSDYPGAPITSYILPIDLIAIAIVSGLAAWLFRPRKDLAEKSSGKE